MVSPSLPLTFFPGSLLLLLFCEGGVVGRQRCPCNGSLWPRMTSDCGGWWCDEWVCSLLFCTYKYTGLADPDEFAFAASIALQAYFEGRSITKEDVDKCIVFWRNNISEKEEPIKRKRAVCCEPRCSVPCPSDGRYCYEYWTHGKREIPYLYRTHQTDSLIEVSQLSLVTFLHRRLKIA